MDSGFQYLWLIIFFPMVGFIVNGLFGKKLGDKIVSWIGPGVVFGSLIVSFVANPGEIVTRRRSFNLVTLRVYSNER